jgi:23S rRNA maturation mini-RNase III
MISDAKKELEKAENIKLVLLQLVGDMFRNTFVRFSYLAKMVIRSRRINSYQQNVVKIFNLLTLTGKVTN